MGDMVADAGKFDSLGIVIAHTGTNHDSALQAVGLGLEAMKIGKEVGFFLISDGVWNAIQNSGEVAGGLGQIMTGGGKVFLSEEHLLAAGIPKKKLIAGAEIVEDVYGGLVDLIMEEWDRVIIC